MSNDNNGILVSDKDIRLEQLRRANEESDNLQILCSPFEEE